MRYILADWETAILMPLFKKGDRGSPESYRPIALLSHARKVVDSAIAMMIRGSYEFSENQLGFQQGTGPETAIMRHVYNAKSMNITAFLDLKQAYDLVPRDLLYRVAKAKMP